MASSSTKDRMRETNENILIVEMQNLNSRVAELIKQFGLLTFEIGNVADELEKQQVGIESCKADIKSLKANQIDIAFLREELQKVSSSVTATHTFVRNLEDKIRSLIKPEKSTLGD